MAVFTEGQTTYRYQASTIGWTSAKKACECEGNLAILDTEEKQTQLLADVYVQLLFLDQDSHLLKMRQNHYSSPSFQTLNYFIIAGLFLLINAPGSELHPYNTGFQYRWIELPPNYGENTANGELLTNTNKNFWSGMNFFKVNQLHIMNY